MYVSLWKYSSVWSVLRKVIDLTLETIERQLYSPTFLKVLKLWLTENFVRVVYWQSPCFSHLILVILYSVGEASAVT